MNKGEWDDGERRRLLTADAGAASVDKISANAKSRKMTIKAMKRESFGSG